MNDIRCPHCKKSFKADDVFAHHVEEERRKFEDEKVKLRARMEVRLSGAQPAKHIYDNTIFHRVIKDFMIQGGDPTGTGAGGPGYRFNDEPFDGEYAKGTVAMANAGPNTNGSQFFIMHGEQALPPNYVIFGNVVDGLDALDAIATAEVVMSASGEPSKPVTPVKIKSVDITEQ